MHVIIREISIIIFICIYFYFIIIIFTSYEWEAFKSGVPFPSTSKGTHLPKTLKASFFYV